MGPNYFSSVSGSLLGPIFFQHISQWSFSDIDLASFVNGNIIYEACGSVDAAVEILKMSVKVLKCQWKF